MRWSKKKADFPPSENSCEAAEINMKKQLLFNSTSFPTTIWYICIITYTWPLRFAVLPDVSSKKNQASMLPDNNLETP